MAALQIPHNFLAGPLRAAEGTVAAWPFYS